MTQRDLAAKLFVSYQAIGKWERGEATPNPEAISLMAKIFDVSADELLGGTLRPSSSGGKAIPVLGSIPAGIPLEAVEDIIDWEEIPNSMCTSGKEYFALRVKGDSMWPDYLPGDVVIVRKTPKCESGEDCIVYVNGYDATLKQVKLGEQGKVTIVPRNPQYPPRTYSAEEVTDLPVSIAGVVVELRRKIQK